MRNFLNFAILGVLLHLLHHTSIECSFEEARVRKFAILGVSDSSVATFSAYRIAGNIGGV